jgi:RNA polymerase sigma factor (sigma-70 family)
MKAESSLEDLVERSKAGDRSALEEVAKQLRDSVYSIALRMLWHPEDAADATQEILIRVITHLGDFRGESRFMTWVYRVAVNHLSTVRKGRLERLEYTFEGFGRELDENLVEGDESRDAEAERSLLLEEIKIGCTHGMLLCLDRPHRLAYILGEILDLTGPEASEALGLSPAAYRKRLSRARARIIEFMKSKCGLVNPENPCRCRRRVPFALETRRVDPQWLLFAHDPARARRFPEILREIRKLEEAQRAVALFRSHPTYAAPGRVATIVEELIRTQA